MFPFPDPKKKIVWINYFSSWSTNLAKSGYMDQGDSAIIIFYFPYTNSILSTR